MAKTQAQIDFERSILAAKGLSAVEPEQEPYRDPNMSYGSGYTRETIPRPIINGERERYSAAGAMENIPGSAKAYGESLIAVAKQPELFAEAAKMLFTGEGLASLKQYYVDTYGSPEKALRKAYQDPVMFMSDLSFFGAPLRIVGKLAGLAGKAGSTAQKGILKTADVLESVDPAGAAVRATMAGVANVPGVRGFPEATYETNLKMGTSPTSRYSDPKVRSRVIDTLLSEQIPVSEAGVEKLNKIVEARTVELDRLIDLAEKEGKTIPLPDILRPLRELQDELGDPVTNPFASAQTQEIDKFIKGWLEQLDSPVDPQTGSPSFKLFYTPSEARALRQRLDKMKRWNKADQTTPPLQKQVVEEVATGARQGLRSAVEGYGTTGMDISRLLEAEEPLLRAANRMGQNNQLGLRQIIGMGAGAGIGAGGSGFDQMLGFLIAGGAALMTPQNKERLARVIYKSRDLTSDQKRTLLGYVATQSGPLAERGEEVRGQ